MDISLSNVNDTDPEWSNADFVNHYFYGNAESIALRKVGHLEKIVAAYWQTVEGRLKGQIADEARKNIGQTFFYAFDNKYYMESVVFSIGRTKIGGLFFGTSTLKNGALEVNGEIEFYLTDKFTDPLDLDFDLPSAQVYDIFDSWNCSVRGLIHKNRTKSRFKY